MKLPALLFVLLFVIGFQPECSAKEENMALIYGKVTDFEGNPVAGADIELKNERFETLYSTKSDSAGKYALIVRKGRYPALAACKDYATKNLEYWAWNVIADSNLEINPRFQGLEVYAVNAFLIQRVPSSMQIYFRPMSLKRMQLAGGMEKLKKSEFIDIAPRLKKADIKVMTNGHPVDILEINRVNENASPEQKIAAYLIQTGLPEAQDKKIWRICITLRDCDTEEQGEGCLFWENPGNNLAADARAEEDGGGPAVPEEAEEK